MLPPQSAPPAEPINLTAKLAKMFNLPHDTPADTRVLQLLAKLAARLQDAPDPAKFRPVAAVQAMLSDRRYEFEKTKKTRVAAKVKAALDGHQIPKGMRSWATALCESNESAFDDFCEKSGPTFACLFQPHKQTARSYSANEGGGCRLGA